MSFLYSLIGFLIAIGVLVAVHEFGHFWVARKLGVKVLRFSVGFGRPIWKKIHGPDQTEYVLAAIPLGGYVKMLGENDPDAPIAHGEAHRAFDNQPIWKRSLIVAAGPGINFLFALIIFFLLGLPAEQSIKPVLGPVAEQSILGQVGGQEGDTLVSINGRSVSHAGQYDLYVFNQVLQGNSLDLVLRTESGTERSVTLDVDGIPIYNINPRFLVRTLGLAPPIPEISTELSRVLPDTPASIAGLKVGDVVTEVDGEKVAGWRELVGKIQSSPDKELLLTIAREDSLLRIAVTPEAQPDANGEPSGRLGIGPVVLPYKDELLTTVDRGLVGAMKYGAEQTWLMSAVTLRMLWKMVTLQVSHKNISGPITIADVAGQAIQVGLDSYLFILAVISISLGVMNLLPIPMLDGGHLMMYAVELVGGQKLAHEVFAVGQRLGIVMLLGLMSLAFYNDIFRLLN